MLPSVHENATTTPAMRRAVREAEGTVDALAARFGQARDTIRKGRRRASTADRSHTPHWLAKTLNDGQEALVLYLRMTLRLPLDDLPAVVREFIEAAMSRSALDRMLRRHGVSKLPKETGAEPRTSKPFKAYEPGFVHIDIQHLPQMRDEDRRRYAFVAIDRATRPPRPARARRASPRSAGRPRAGSGAVASALAANVADRRTPSRCSWMRHRLPRFVHVAIAPLVHGLVRFRCTSAGEPAKIGVFCNGASRECVVSPGNSVRCAASWCGGGHRKRAIDY
jgi:hypothetical protein